MQSPCLREDHIYLEIVKYNMYARYMVKIFELTLVGSCLRRTIGYRLSIVGMPFMKLLIPLQKNEQIRLVFQTHSVLTIFEEILYSARGGTGNLLAWFPTCAALNMAVTEY